MTEVAVDTSQGCKTVTDKDSSVTGSLRTEGEYFREDYWNPGGPIRAHSPLEEKISKNKLDKTFQ